MDSTGTSSLSPITAVRQGAQVPESFHLDQNYPNPFNPSTRIEYSIPGYSYVSLRIDNVMGQEAVTLFSGVRQAGTYAATFDGGGFASGVYFDRLSTGGVSITEKLVLMK